MTEEIISRRDLQKLILLLREIVDLQIKHIKAGFTSKELAETFSDVYIRELAKQLDPQTAARFSRTYHHQPPLNNEEAIGTYCLNLAAAILDAVCKRFQKEE